MLKEGDEVSAIIINVDRKARSIQLSIKAKDNADAQEGMQRLAQGQRARERRHDEPGRPAARQARQPEPGLLIRAAMARRQAPA